MKLRQRGFTLIETLIYLALFALIITGIVSAAYMLFETGDRNQAKSMLQDEKDFLSARIDYALVGTKVASVAGTSLTAVKYDASSVTIAQSSGGITIAGNRMNNTDTTISDTQFTLGSS